MWKVVKRNKKYDKRKLSIYYDGKKVTDVFPCGGWYFCNTRLDDELTRMVCRQHILKNLYWLIGKDCDDFEWLKHIEKLDNGHVDGGGACGQTIPMSLFFNIEEKLCALESFKNNI